MNFSAGNSLGYASVYLLGSISRLLLLVALAVGGTPVHLSAQSSRSSGSSDFPAIYNSEPSRSEPLNAADAARSMTFPAGFNVNVFASEPEVQNPIGMTWDAHGRLWVAENYTYAERGVRFDLGLRDRVVILEDRDKDGKAEHRSVFADNLQVLTSIEIGYGGVWLMTPPRLLFIPDANEDGIADGPAEIKLDGFDVGTDSHHNFANGLKWGPDGWLYGRVGHSCPGKVGLPGSEPEDRFPIDGGIWRYSPKTQVFEALCHGTVNPWGHDWDANGELFFVNTVIGHLWHMLPGSHFIESFGESDNPRVYERLDMIADHYHFDINGSWTESRDGKANEFGGGHAHTGAAICMDRRWPTAFQGKLFTINMHGKRANVERIERSGSGYIAKHEPDLFVSADPFFRGLDLNFGPDGALYVSDWSDTGECHDSTGVHRTSGRIFRITPPGFGVTGADFGATRGEYDASSKNAFAKPECLAGDGPLPKLWTRFQSGELTQLELLDRLRSSNEHERVWAIRLLTDGWPLDTILGPRLQTSYPADCETILDSFLATLRLHTESESSRREGSGLVLSTYASTLQRMPLQHRLRLGEALVQYDEFQDDIRLQNLVWFGLSATASTHPEELATLIGKTRWTRLQQHIARSIAEQLPTMVEPGKAKNISTANGAIEKDESQLRFVKAFDALLEEAVNLEAESLNRVLHGLALGFHGRKKVDGGTAWKQFADTLSIRDDLADPTLNLFQRLNAYMGAGHAIQDLVHLIQDREVEMKLRQQALETLSEAEYADLESLCLKLLDTRILNTSAARILSSKDSVEIGRRIASKYRNFQAEDRPAILDILCSRASFARALLEVIARNNSPIPRADLTPAKAKAIQSLNDQELNTLLEEVWGKTTDPSGNHQLRIAELRQELTPEQLALGNLVNGRRLFENLCSQCHRLYGSGRTIGPDLTGSQRVDLDYLLLHIVDPNASVAKDFRATLIRTQDGRTLSGLIVRENEEQLELQASNSTYTLSKSDIEERKIRDVSAMPEGLLDSLSNEQIRDLFRYLQHPTQIALP